MTNEEHTEHLTRVRDSLRERVGTGEPAWGDDHIRLLAFVEDYLAYIEGERERMLRVALAVMRYRTDSLRLLSEEKLETRADAEALVDRLCKQHVI